MTHSLGKGLESLIPNRDEAPQAPPVLDVLAHQAGLHEPIYRFHDQVVATAVSSRPRGAMPAGMPGREAGSRRSESIFSIEVSKIGSNPQQPRREFSVDELTSLASSIREHGILQPLLVTKQEFETPSGLDVRYELVAGERRLRAAKLAGLRTVPVIIRVTPTDERAKLELALIENIQREDLNPLERARAFERLVNEFGMMQKDVAERIGKSREVVANAIRLLRLPEEIQTAILANALSESHARILLTLEANPIEQMRLFNQIRSASLSVRDADEAARVAGGSLLQRRRKAIGALDANTRVLQRQLEEAFGTKVKLLKRGDHGKIVVEFYSDEELRGILERVAKREEGYV